MSTMPSEAWKARVFAARDGLNPDTVHLDVSAREDGDAVVVYRKGKVTAFGGLGGLCRYLGAKNGVAMSVLESCATMATSHDAPTVLTLDVNGTRHVVSCEPGTLMPLLLLDWELLVPHVPMERLMAVTMAFVALSGRPVPCARLLQALFQAAGKHMSVPRVTSAYFQLVQVYGVEPPRSDTAPQDSQAVLTAVFRATRLKHDTTEACHAENMAKFGWHCSCCPPLGDDVYFDEVLDHMQDAGCCLDPANPGTVPSDIMWQTSPSYLQWALRRYPTLVFGPDDASAVIGHRTVPKVDVVCAMLKVLEDHGRGAAIVSAFASLSPRLDDLSTYSPGLREAVQAFVDRAQM